MASPKKLSHLVLQTNRREQMVDWYCTVLGAEVLFQNKHIAFISYDDEHHRVAFIDPGPLADKKPAEGKTARASSPLSSRRIGWRGPAAKWACTTWRSPSLASTN